MATTAALVKLGVAGLTLVALVLVGSFTALCSRAAAGSRLARYGAAVEAGAFVFGALLVLLIAGARHSLRCDESCDNALGAASGKWWWTTGAWQWDAQLVAALIGLACVLLAVGLLAWRRYRLAPVAAALAAAAFGVFAALLAPLGDALGI
jgi:hypothetical protein